MKKKPETNRVVFLEGKKVNLRPVLKEDIPKFTVWVNDQEVTQYVVMHTPQTLEQEEKWFQTISSDSDKDVVLAIETKEGELIGITGLHHIHWKDRNATHGIFIGNKDYWSDGYGTEAGRLLFRYGFESLGLKKINSSVIDYNDRSLNYHLKCGFKVVGRLKKQIFKKGKFRDQIFVDLFLKDFEKACKK